ncbi:hypothetical protein SAMN06296952_0535 [Oscillospiraceae bacterium]|nr:hypothetical protein SAMN06296952_0535 [Oscillospiraceae bacterium]
MDRQTKSAIMEVIFFISLAVVGAMAILENLYTIRPSGDVLTFAYLDSRCRYEIVRLCLLIVLFWGVFFPLVLLFLKTYPVRKPIIYTIVILITVGFVFLFRIPDYFIEPVVVEKIVVSKEERGLGRSPTPYLIFGEDDKVKVTYPDYSRIEEGDKVYVVYCDDTVLDVFPESEFSYPDYSYHPD